MNWQTDFHVPINEDSILPELEPSVLELEPLLEPDPPPPPPQETRVNATAKARHMFKMRDFMFFDSLLTRQMMISPLYP